MRMDEQKVLVVGTGKSGIAATELLLNKNVKVTLFDSNQELDVEGLFEKFPQIKGTPVIVGELSEEQMDDFTVLVLNIVKEKGLVCETFEWLVT